MKPRAASFAVAVAALLLVLVAPGARAQALRAWLNRDHIALGETTTLNVEVDGAGADAPDWSPLLGDPFYLRRFRRRVRRSADQVSRP